MECIRYKRVRGVNIYGKYDILNLSTLSEIFNENEVLDKRGEAQSKGVRLNPSETL